MNSSHMDLLGADRADRLLAELQRQQHLFPHQLLGEALAQVRGRTGFCPQAGEAAVELLSLDGTRKIGRLRRSEIAQLARTIYRLWRQNLAAASESQPA
jgi:hypothetical protein